MISVKTLLVLAIGLLIGLGSARAGEESGWNPQAAAQYLDGRYAEWAAFKGADRGQGKDKVSCLSCHTSLSYALGRPVLRQVSGDDQPTAQEAKQLEQVRSRVAHWGELDTPRYRLSYDHEEKKKVESWGTEAVLNALVLASDDRRRGLSAPERLDEAGAAEPLGHAAQGRTGRRLVGLAGFRAPALGSRRVALLRGGAGRHRRRDGPRLSQGR